MRNRGNGKELGKNYTDRETKTVIIKAVLISIKTNADKLKAELSYDWLGLTYEATFMGIKLDYIQFLSSLLLTVNNIW